MPGKRANLGQERLKRSQEVWRSVGFRFCLLFLRHRVKDLGLGTLNVFDFKHGRHISTAIAVVWCGPHGDQLIIKHILVSLLNQLVSSTNQRQIVGVHKLVSDFGAKQVSSTAWTGHPLFHFFRVGPDQITKSSHTRNLLITLNAANLIECIDLWR